MTDEKLIDKIRKMLALASNNPNIHEAELAAEKAQKLIIENNLSLVDIQSNEAPKFASYAHESKVDPWRRKLAQSISVNLGGHCWFKRNERGTSNGTFTFTAPSGSAESMAALFTYIESQLEALYIIESIKARNDPFGGRVHGKTIRSAWFAGAVNTISKRLKDRKAEIENESVDNSTALVLSKNALDKYVEDNFPTLRKHAAVSRIGDRDAYNSGKIAGGKVDFGDSRVRTTQRQLTS